MAWSLMAVLYIVVAYALRYTAWGRHLYATGDDAEAARLAGINTKRVLLSAYLVAGVVIAVSAWILAGRVGGAGPEQRPERQPGVDHRRRHRRHRACSADAARSLGSLLGALIVQVFDNGLALAGVDANYQVLAVGILVIAAVSVDQWIRKVKA